MKKIQIEANKFYEISNVLDEIKCDLKPITFYDGRMEKACNHVMEVIDIFNDCELDKNIPIKTVEREIRYSISDLNNFLMDYKENDNVIEKVDMLTDILNELESQEQKVLTVKEMQNKLDNNPELMKVMSLAMEIEETDPEAIQKATEYLQKCNQQKELKERETGLEKDNSYEGD